MKSRKAKSRFGRTVFLLPVVAAILIVVIAIVFQVSPNGTLYVSAETSGKYYQARILVVPAAVNGVTHTTPFNLTLSQGQYLVQFSPLNGFESPSPILSTVIHGQAIYATEVYNPIVKLVGNGGGVFNATLVRAVRSVTPVVWVNQKNSYFVIYVGPVGRVIIPPLQNFTYVFTTAGNYGFSTLSGNSTGTVEVA